jgi:hypothetical protein
MGTVALSTHLTGEVILYTYFVESVRLDQEDGVGQDLAFTGTVKVSLALFSFPESVLGHVVVCSS